jgi:hypothetical protein
MNEQTNKPAVDLTADELLIDAVSLGLLRWDWLTLT